MATHIEYVPVDLSMVKVGDKWTFVECVRCWYDIDYRLLEAEVIKASPKYLTIAYNGSEKRYQRALLRGYGFPTPISEQQVKDYNQNLDQKEAEEAERKARVEAIKAVDWDSLLPHQLNELWVALKLAGKVKQL